MTQIELLADISRQFLRKQKIYKYRMKKISEMSDDEVISRCHWFCEENNLIDKWNAYREQAESEYRYCSYLDEFIDEGVCYDLQMITEGYIKSSALPEMVIDKEKCLKYCSKCEHCL